MSAERNVVELLVIRGGMTIEAVQEELGWDYITAYELLTELQTSYVLKRRKSPQGFVYEAACRDYGGKAWWQRRVAVCDMFRDFDGMTATELTDLCGFADRHMSQSVLLGMFRDGLLRREDELSTHRYYRVSREAMISEHRRLLKYRVDLLVDNAFKRAEMRQRVVSASRTETVHIDTDGEMKIPELYQRMIIERPPAPEQVVQVLGRTTKTVRQLCDSLDLCQPKLMVTLMEMVDAGQVALAHGKVALRAPAKR